MGAQSVEVVNTAYGRGGDLEEYSLSWQGNAQVRRIHLRSGEDFRLTYVPTVGSRENLLECAYYASIADHSPEGQALFASALLERGGELLLPKGSTLVSSSNLTHFSGINIGARKIRKGALAEIENWLTYTGGNVQSVVRRIVRQIENRGHLALVIADQRMDVGVVEIVS